MSGVAAFSCSFKISTPFLHPNAGIILFWSEGMFSGFNGQPPLNLPSANRVQR